MKRKSVLLGAVAAGIAAVVVLTTGAFAGASGGTTSTSDQPGDSFAAFIACLASHGVQVPSDDPPTVKQWLGEHQDEPAVKAALDACAGPADTGGGKTGGSDNADVPGPAPADLVACLERHGVVVPNDVKQDAGAFKQWLGGVIDQPAVRAAVDACTSPPPDGQK